VGWRCAARPTRRIAWCWRATPRSLSAPLGSLRPWRCASCRRWSAAWMRWRPNCSASSTASKPLSWAPIRSWLQSSIAQSIDFWRSEQAKLKRAIDEHIDRHPGLKQERERLLSIPAVGDKTANRMLCLLLARRFNSASQAAAFVGLTPIEHQSGSSVRGRPRLSKAGNPRLRAALYMAAVVAIRHNPDVRALYERMLARGKAKMSALCAAMRKLVHICFGVIKNQQDYEPQTP
jgi:transposase